MATSADPLAKPETATQTLSTQLSHAGDAVRHSSAHQSANILDDRRRKEVAVSSQPQVHIIGEVVSGRGFQGAATCRWAVEAGDGQGASLWALVAGAPAGQTQTASPTPGDDEAVWAHPIDVHYIAGTTAVCETCCGPAIASSCMALAGHCATPFIPTPTRARA